MESKIYWKEAVKLLKYLSKSSDFIETSSELKLEVFNKIINSINDNNYLVIKLLIYSKITKEILLNFLFYNAINKEKTYTLYIEYPSRYCNTYMFNILPNDLPSLSSVFNMTEIEELEKRLKVASLLSEIGTCEISKLKELFPRAFHFASVNPFSKELY